MTSLVCATVGTGIENREILKNVIFTPTLALERWAQKKMNHIT